MVELFMELGYIHVMVALFCNSWHAYFFIIVNLKHIALQS